MCLICPILKQTNCYSCAFLLGWHGILMQKHQLSLTAFPERPNIVSFIHFSPPLSKLIACQLQKEAIKWIAQDTSHLFFIVLEFHEVSYNLEKKHAWATHYIPNVFHSSRHFYFYAITWKEVTWKEQWVEEMMGREGEFSWMDSCLANLTKMKQKEEKRKF